MVTEPCDFPPLDRESVAEHVKACPRCRANLRAAAARGAAWERQHGGEVKDREVTFYAARDARAAAWPVERIRQIVATLPIDNPP